MTQKELGGGIIGRLNAKKIKKQKGLLHDAARGAKVKIDLEKLSDDSPKEKSRKIKILKRYYKLCKNKDVEVLKKVDKRTLKTIKDLAFDYDMEDYQFDNFEDYLENGTDKREYKKY